MVFWIPKFNTHEHYTNERNESLNQSLTVFQLKGLRQYDYKHWRPLQSMYVSELNAYIYSVASIKPVMDGQ